MEIVIRKAIESDLAAFSMLWQFYLYHQSSFSLDDIGENGRFDIDDDYLIDVLVGDEDCDAYIILVKGVIVGFVTIERTEISKKVIPELSDLFILPKYRNQGLAKHVIESLMLSGNKEWHVAIYQEDKQAHQFWERMFGRLEIADVVKIEPPESEGFREFVVTNA